MTSRGGPPKIDSVSRIAGLTIVNAMIFQEVLAYYESQVEHLRQTLQRPDCTSAFAEHWNFILSYINYYPIFHVAHQLLLGLPSNPDVENALRSLAQTALEVVRQRAALRHDLMGRIYHRLLADANYLGTFYTSVPAATLLLKLLFDRDRWSMDWANLDEVATFRVGDLACGTGTLLMAAAEAISDNYLRACGEQQVEPQLPRLSRLLIEDIIYGYDVLLSALHLTASTLALRAPDVTFRLTHMWALPLGGQHHRLGSIEFLRGFQAPITADLFGASVTPGQVTAREDRRQQFARIPDLDVCVVNPPFTRSVGGNLLFGSLPPTERQPMQRELSKLLRIPRVHASGTAGLGSVFAATGDLHLKVGGRMALVLSKALLSGVAWQETHNLIQLKYQLEQLIVSYDPGRWNFSENTDLSEVLLIARKLDSTGAAPPAVKENVTCINLWKNPTTAVEALGVAHVVMGDAPLVIDQGQGALEITLGDTKFGEAIAMPWVQLRERSWIGPCAFAQVELLRVTQKLIKGNFILPGSSDAKMNPLCPLGQLGTLGPDRRDIHDGFSVSGRRTAYPAFWGHDASSMMTLAVTPNKYLSPLPRATKGRPLRKASDLWPRAGRVLIAERLWLKTQRLVSVYVDTPVLSNVWWPFNQGGENEGKPLAIWLNSTLGLLILWAEREETRGAWVDFKKPVLTGMPVLDLSALSSVQKDAMAAAYDQLCQSPLLPFPQMAQDPVRRDIDKAIAQVLGLPDFSVLRDLLAQEPVVCLKPLS